MSVRAGTEDSAEEVLALLHRAQTPAVTKPELKSGEALQNVAGNSTWNIALKGAAEGTYTVQFGPTEAAANEVIKAVELLAKTATVVTLDVPAGWWVKVTVANATIAGTTVVTRA